MMDEHPVSIVRVGDMVVVSRSDMPDPIVLFTVSEWTSFLAVVRLQDLAPDRLPRKGERL